MQYIYLVHNRQCLLQIVYNVVESASEILSHFQNTQQFLIIIYSYIKNLMWLQNVTSDDNNKRSIITASGFEILIHVCIVGHFDILVSGGLDGHTFCE